jgi:hypothetical protein
MAIYEQKSRAYLSPHTWRRHKSIYRRRRLRLFSTQDLKLYLGVPLHARHIKLTFKHIIMLITDWQICWLPSFVCDEMDRISTFLNSMEVWDLKWLDISNNIAIMLGNLAWKLLQGDALPWIVSMTEVYQRF